MTVQNAFLAGLLAVALTVGGIPASIAQEAGMVDEVAEAEERSPADNWLKVCSGLEDGRKACIMRQVVTNSGVFVGSFLLRDDPSQESRLLAVASVPLGMLLPFGLSWQIDGGKPVRVPYMLCDPQSCSAQLVVNEAYIQSLKRGATLKLIAKNRLNEDVTVDITLAGFTSVYDDPDGIDINQLNQSNTTENVLEQVLQDRAEALRQQLQDSVEGGAESTPEDAPATEEETPAQ
jgi:invasion protein IalB